MRIVELGGTAMSTALVISLGAVAICLFAVFVALRGAKAKKETDGDGGTTYTASDSSSDCGPSDGGSCGGGDGGGGGGD